MASDESSLHSLETLMLEFFNGSTSNQRKREIEQLLQNFSQQSGAWRHCVYFMNNSENQYVHMYSLQVFEDLINRMWLGEQSSTKMEIRQFLNQYLLANHKRLPHFIRNKLVKVIVDIAKLDWPHFYPDFFTSIIQLIQQPSTVVLGLILLRTTSEEFASPREDLSVARKEELKRLLLHEVPSVLQVTCTILDGVLEKHRRVVTTVTPPPSPTLGLSPSQSRSSPGDGGSIFSTTHLQDNDLTITERGSLVGKFLGTSPKSRQNLCNPMPPLDSELEEISTLALQFLAHLFSWIPLSTTMTPSLLTSIFYFAEFGCNLGNSSTINSSKLGILAMNCINEVMSKNCVPSEFEEFLFKLFQQTFQLLQRITKDTGAQSENRLAELDEGYLEKFTEFLNLFVSVHFRRFEAHSHFPVLELLTLLFKYTFKQPSLDGFYSCLDIWTIFLEYVGNKVSSYDSRCPEAQSILQRYKDILMMLLTELMKKIQFRYNQTQLEELDNEEVDDNNETEWQVFLRHSLEVIAKVAEILPSEAFSLLFPIFREQGEMYLGLAQHLTQNEQGYQLSVSEEAECRRLHCSLKDLATLEQALGRLAEHFYGENYFSERFADGKAIVERLCQLCLFGTQFRVYSLKTLLPSVLGPDFLEVHAHALASLQAYCHWVYQFHLESKRHQQHQEKFATIISSAVDSLVPLLHKDVPRRVMLPACHLLASITTTVRPSFFIALERIQKLYQDVIMQGFRQLPEENQILIYRSLCNTLILPWPELPENEQQWEVRSNNQQRLMESLTSQFRQVSEMPEISTNKQVQANAKPCIQSTLRILKDLVVNNSGEVTRTKQSLYNSIASTVQLTTMTIFPLYIHEADTTDEVMGFLLALFGGFRVQIGVPFTEQIIQRLMCIFTGDQLAETILQDGGLGAKVVEKFIRILKLIVQEPGSSFKSFLPSIITLAMEQIYPIIAERPSPDIKSELFDLLHELLLFHWKHFFRASVLSSMGDGEDVVENQPQFIAIMQAFGQSFLQPDISIFKQNLECLQSLHSKRKLFNKKLFRECMLFQFLNVLLQVLVHRSHDLLQEEIIIALYSMASVDFTMFYSRFLPEFLRASEMLTSSQKTELGNNFRVEKDLPSFTHSVRRLVGDLRYYRLCNSSLPPGTVTFN